MPPIHQPSLRRSAASSFAGNCNRIQVLCDARQARSIDVERGEFHIRRALEDVPSLATRRRTGIEHAFARLRVEPLRCQLRARRPAR